MNRIVLILICCLYCLPVVAQDMLFLGEGRKDVVRLFWIPKEIWPKGVEGFNIKRRSDTDDHWTLLNPRLIVPGTVQDKPLDNIGLSNQAFQELIRKRKDMIGSGALKEITSPGFIEFLQNENMVKGIAIMLNSDFHKALISGFAYVDNDPPQAERYTYGLFAIHNNEESATPSATYEWKYGSEPAIMVDMEGQVKAAFSKKKAVELVWKIDVDDYKKYQTLNGFHVFIKKGDEYEKVSKRPIWVSLKDKEKATLYYKAENVDLSKKQVYAAAPNTIFNTSGNYHDVTVEVREIPENLQVPVLESPARTGDTLLINWTFPESQQPFIKGYYVQMGDNTNLKNISDLLPSDKREFMYTSLPAADDAHYHFRIIAVTNDGLELWSNRKIFFNKEITRPSQPGNLKGEVINTDSGTSVKLSWERPTKNASHIQEYYLYTSSPNTDRVIREGSIEKIIKEEYVFPVYTERAAKYSFAVSAVSDQYEESELSEKITVLVPSKSLPFINLWPISKNGRTIKLNWVYEDIADLAGFRLFQNGEIVADEQVLDTSSREWTSSDLEPGTYTYRLMAVTFSNIQSEMSDERKFIIK